MRNVQVAALLLPLLIASCQARKVQSSSPASFVMNNPGSKWPNPRLIPVCIVNRGEVKDGLFNDVVRHVKREFASRAGIGLVGFGQCASEEFNQQKIRVYFNRVHDWENQGGAGGGLSMLGRTHFNCGDSCKGGTMRLDIGRSGDYPSNVAGWILDWTRHTAVHEFGHALGLHHEHQRTDAVDCNIDQPKIERQGSDVYIGGFDPNSVMSYCSGQGGLSDGDVEGLQWLYPVTKDLGNSVSIRSELSGKCIDIDGFSFDPAAKIQQWECNGGLRNQLWRLKDLGAGLFEIRSSSTDLCLDVVDASRDNGAKVVQWFCLGSDNQKVRILDRGNGRKSFQFVHSDRCLDIDGSRSENGIQLQQWDCYGNPAQNFTY